MKKCVHCGKENVDEAIFCADCGAKLGTYNSSTSSSASTTDNSLNYSSNQTSNQANNKEPNKLKVCCCYVPIVLFVLFLAAALIYAGFAESFGTYYPDDFNYLDSNADGKVTFEEITEVNWIYLDNSTLKRFFEGHLQVPAMAVITVQEIPKRQIVSTTRNLIVQKDMS